MAGCGAADEERREEEEIRVAAAPVGEVRALGNNAALMR
jgi:hypothetical protein